MAGKSGIKMQRYMLGNGTALKSGFSFQQQSYIYKRKKAVMPSFFARSQRFTTILLEFCKWIIQISSTKTWKHRDCRTSLCCLAVQPQQLKWPCDCNRWSFHTGKIIFTLSASNGIRMEAGHTQQVNRMMESKP